MKLIHIVGNRPQFIKLALLNRALEARNGPGIIVHTGQHFDPNMSDVFFQELHIPAPDYSLGINSLSHNNLIGSMLTGIDGVLEAEKPHGVIVYGDTNTTQAGPLAAKKRNIPLAHIEAGIRTGNESMPEEANRYLADRMASLNFCCTYLGLENLRKEGYFSGLIHSGVHNSGDLMLDATLSFKDQALQQSKAGMDAGSFVLATIHRAENLENIDRLKNIVEALNTIHRQIPVVFPMHPRTGMIAEAHRLPVHFKACDALGYLDMLALLQRCRLVITDSGGLSREAFFLNKPVLVIMENPFWPELFLHGPCLQAAPEKEAIIEKMQALLALGKPFNTDIFGKGEAAAGISEIILSAW